ncbi:uncharacterized protein [Lepeophtheirus salmonis]|uniref:uncharacterized protein isoform X2 n=1 Tax=Lepeophtheirus salmonis TaxID=72036 RepID=UPI001AE7068E|nr:uncharacterized protein LOC121126809 isoform X2 [Lepeophtheirus salmonis]
MYVEDEVCSGRTIMENVDKIMEIVKLEQQVKGKDLPGAVKVTPEGLKEVIAKREFIELGKEGSNMLDSVIQNPTNNFDNIYEKQNPWCQKSRTDINGASKNYSFSAPKPFNHSEKKTSITIDHRKEICQESLKSTIQSAISDIEVNLNLNSAKVYEAHLLDEPKIPELAPIILYSDDLNDLNAHEINNAELVSSIAESIEHLKESKNELRSEDNKLNTEICSLKRRNPREMYTDSSFYNPKHHPSVAEQFEMAHRLSSSLYDDVNKKSTGQKMFLKRAKKSGHWIYSDDLKEDKDCLNVQDIQLSHENKVLNLKLVMNPDGKLYDWTNIQEGILPPMNPLTPEMALNVVKNLEDCKGKGGELFAKRRKRAEKWVIDETSIGKAGHPGEVAQNFFQNSQEEKVIEKNICQLKERIKGQCKLESHQLTDEIQKFFQEEQKYKQEKVFEMRQNQQMSKHDLSQENNSSNLPSNNLLQVNNWTVHNKQGINVWASSIPESWSKFTTKQLNNSISNIMRNTREYDTDKTIMNSDLKNNGHVSIDVSTAATTKKTETNDLEKKKKKEYERWFKDQEKLQQVVEYDCFVEYVEKIDSNSFVSDGIIGNMNKDEVNFILFQIPEKDIDISITNGKIYNNEIQEYNEKKEQIIEKVEHQHKRSVQEHIIGGGSNKLKCNKHSPNSEDFQKNANYCQTS